MERVQSNLEHTEVLFNNTLDQIRNISDRIFVNKQLQNVLETEYTDLQDVYSDYSNLTFLSNYLQTYDEIASLRIYTENRSLLNNQFIVKADPYIVNSEWYDKARVVKGVCFWELKVDSVAKRNYLSLIRSLWSASSGEFLGVLVLNVNPDLIQKTLSNSIYETVIFLGDEFLYSSKEYIPIENKIFLKEMKKTSSTTDKIQSVFYNGERVGIVTKRLVAKNSMTLSFFIMYIIPVKGFYKTSINLLILTGILILVMIVLSLIVLMIYSKYINSRVNKIQTGISNVVKNNFEISESIGGKDEFADIYANLYEMSGNIKNLIDKIYIQNLEKEQLAARQNEISFKMLSSQINPHFLFNTLETIRMKSLTSGDKEVATMLKLLANLLRYNLSVKGKPVPLIDEVNAIQNYLNIQHMRFGDRISYDVITLCDIQQIYILPLLIQPIVENSFIHGLENKVSGGFIYVLINSNITEENEELIISVKDNGSGISEEKLEEMRKELSMVAPEDYSNSIGIKNVNSRIKMFYGNDSGIEIESKLDEGTCVTIKIVQKMEKAGKKE